MGRPYDCQTCGAKFPGGWDFENKPDIAELASNVYYNHGDRPVIIITRYCADPFGGPGIVETQCMVEPGQGIDVSVIGFKKSPIRSKPE